MTKGLFASFIASILLLACGPKITPEQEVRLEQLTHSIDSIAKEVNRIDSHKVAKAVETFFIHRDFLQNKMRDTLSREIIFKLDSYIGLKKSMRYLRSEYLIILAETSKMRTQLEDLNRDVYGGLINEKKFNTYYNLELEQAKDLKKATHRLSLVREKALPVFEANYLFVDSLINAYKARINE